MLELATLQFPACIPRSLSASPLTGGVLMFDPISSEQCLLWTPSRGIVALRRAIPLRAGRYVLGPERSCPAEQFEEEQAHLTVCCAKDPSWRATHLLFAGEVQAVQLIGAQVFHYVRHEGPRVLPWQFDLDAALSSAPGADGRAEQPVLVPIWWGKPLQLVSP